MHYKTGDSQGGLFDYHQHCAELAARGTSLDRLKAAVAWEAFRGTLEKHLAYEDGTKGGRPAWDPVLMFQVLVLQKFHGLSDAQTEFQILDRFSFQRFLGLRAGDAAPDEKTIWVFKERLGAAGLRALFELFHAQLAAQGLIGQQGKIVDATFVEAPRPRAARQPGHPPAARQQDADARWTEQGGQAHYGYKNHAKADALSKIVEDYTVTPANVHDSQRLDELAAPGDRVIYADSAYSGAPNAEKLAAKKLTGFILAKATRHHPLSKGQQKLNRLKSAIRCRVEHVFARLAHWRADRFRRRNLQRAEFEIGLSNLVYNLDRYAYLLSAG
jgi:transposase, IS5 family